MAEVLALSGILNVRKRRGPTSRDVVNAIQACVRPNKVGHAGTLDPLATGVLVVCVGPATRLVECIQRMRKRYRATFRFGWRSDTDDVEGRLERDERRQPSRDELTAVLARYHGAIEQVPPDYSAVKVRGRRAYDLARRGEQVALRPRAVRIHAMTLVDYAYPDWTVDVECGSGTYVRSLGRDIAKDLGVSAIMAALTRESIGLFAIDGAVDPPRWDAACVAEHLLPIGMAVAELRRASVSNEQARRLRAGQRLDIGSVPAVVDPPGGYAPPGECGVLPSMGDVAAFDSDGRLVALIEARSDGWFPVRCFPE